MIAFELKERIIPWDPRQSAFISSCLNSIPTRKFKVSVSVSDRTVSTWTRSNRITTLIPDADPAGICPSSSGGVSGRRPKGKSCKFAKCNRVILTCAKWASQYWPRIGKMIWCVAMPANTRRWTNNGLKLASVYDAGPTLSHHWFNVSCFLGCPAMQRIEQIAKHNIINYCIWSILDKVLIKT